MKLAESDTIAGESRRLEGGLEGLHEANGRGRQGRPCAGPKGLRVEVEQLPLMEPAEVVASVSAVERAGRVRGRRSGDDGDELRDFARLELFDGAVGALEPDMKALCDGFGLRPKLDVLLRKWW